MKVLKGVWNNFDICVMVSPQYLQIEPFCRPRMFNPYHQMSVGQSMAFCGIVTVFATRGTKWHVWWSPVWAAVLVCLDLRRILLFFPGLITQCYIIMCNEKIKGAGLGTGPKPVVWYVFMVTLFYLFNTKIDSCENVPS